MPTFPEFRDATLGWLGNRPSSQRKIIENFLQQIIGGERNFACAIDDQVQRAFASHFLDNEDGETWKAMQALGFLNNLLDSFCDIDRHQRVLKARDAFMTEDHGLTPEQMNRVALSNSTLPERFAEWNRARDEWQRDVTSVFTGSVLMGWNAAEHARHLEAVQQDA